MVTCLVNMVQAISLVTGNVGEVPASFLLKKVMH